MFFVGDVSSFASYYQDNMVLQREPHKAVILGYGTLGAIVIFALEEDVQNTSGISGPNDKGVWPFVLNPRKKGFTCLLIILFRPFCFDPFWIALLQLIYANTILAIFHQLH